ncbi:hypothetical protein F5X98DRAFT_347545 [Xylaria grammica]|nr:hypothetical protein F5X98DRAFT_347545 [Xylaria grammica]
MASGTISTLLTSTSTGDPPMTTLFTAGNPCSEIRLSSCDSSNSCVVRVLPSALCWDNAYSTWGVGSALSCIVTSTPLAAPVVTASQSFCPLGMTTADGAVQSGSAWCCPRGFDWASESLCQSIITSGMFPQISNACAQVNMVAFAPQTTDSPVTAMFAEAVYLAEQALLPSTPIITKYFTSGVSPTPSASVPSNEWGDSLKTLSPWAKVAIGVGSGIVGSLLVLLGVILIRRHRKRQLRDVDILPKAEKHEMVVMEGPRKGYLKMGPGFGTTANNLKINPARTRCELEAASPGDPDDDIIPLCYPERGSPPGREYYGERSESEFTPVLSATFTPTNQLEPVELEAEPLSSGNKTASRRNTRASSQVLPRHWGIDEYWAVDACSVDSCSSRSSEESVHISSLWNDA